VRLYLFLPSTRSLGVVALKNHLAIECELRPVDLSRGDQRAPEYVALNPNGKVVASGAELLSATVASTGPPSSGHPHRPPPRRPH
jgi:hypothetical protein